MRKEPWESWDGEHSIFYTKRSGPLQGQRLVGPGKGLGRSPGTKERAAASAGKCDLASGCGSTPKFIPCSKMLCLFLSHSSFGMMIPNDSKMTHRFLGKNAPVNRGSFGMVNSPHLHCQPHAKLVSDWNVDVLPKIPGDALYYPVDPIPCWLCPPKTGASQVYSCRNAYVVRPGMRKLAALLRTEHWFTHLPHRKAVNFRAEHPPSRWTVSRFHSQRRFLRGREWHSKDSSMLARSNLIDYSLIVGVLVYELEPCDGQNQPAQLGKSTGELGKTMRTMILQSLTIGLYR